MKSAGWRSRRPDAPLAAVSDCGPSAPQRPKLWRSQVSNKRKQAVQQRDFATARKFIEEADAAETRSGADPQFCGRDFDGAEGIRRAEAAFKKGAKVDPKFREAQYNLAQIPFKKKDYTRARERFDALFKQTPGGDKNQGGADH